MEQIIQLQLYNRCQCSGRWGVALDGSHCKSNLAKIKMTPYKPEGAQKPCCQGYTTTCLHKATPSAPLKTALLSSAVVPIHTSSALILPAPIPGKNLLHLVWNGWSSYNYCGSMEVQGKCIAAGTQLKKNRVVAQQDTDISFRANWISMKYTFQIPELKILTSELECIDLSIVLIN